MPDSHDNSNTSLVAIDFHGDQIVTFQKDGQPFVAMRRVVENLQLDWPTQQRKLAEADRFNCGHIPTVGGDGKRREMLAMPVAKLALWLATVNPNKVPDLRKRERIELYQAESAIALHDYWTKGVAVRGDADGLVTSIDPNIMRALGGMIKGIVNKALSEVLPEMVKSHVANGHIGVVRGVTAGEVLDEAGITNRKGMAGLARRVSNHLRRHCSAKNVVVPLKSLGSSTAYVFDLQVVRDWLLHGGRQMIHRWVEERRGQGALKLVDRS